MEIIILGCHSATPRSNACPSAQLLKMCGHLFLIDCGGATQVALRNVNTKFARIKHTFISRPHGDRFYELFGLISALQLLGREIEVHIYGPEDIKEVVLLILKLRGAYTPFPLYFHEFSGKGPELLYEDDKVSVRIIPLQYHAYANGFFPQEKEGEHRLSMDAVQQHPEIEVCDYQNIKNSKDIILSDGEAIANEVLTFAPQRPQNYAYCSDTLYFEELVADIQGVRMVYHESTFLKDNEELVARTMHVATYQAGLTAKNAGAEALILRHYSSRYADVNLFKAETRGVLPSVYLAEDGKKIIFN